MSRKRGKRLKILLYLLIILIIFSVIALGLLSYYSTSNEIVQTVEHSDYYIDMTLGQGVNYSTVINYSAKGYFSVNKVIHIDVELTMFNDSFFEMTKNTNIIFMFEESFTYPKSYFPDKITPLSGNCQKTVNSKIITMDCNITYSTTGKHPYIISFIDDSGKILYANSLTSTLEITSLEPSIQTSSENKTLTIAILALILTGIIGIAAICRDLFQINKK